MLTDKDKKGAVLPVDGCGREKGLEDQDAKYNSPGEENKVRLTFTCGQTMKSPSNRDTF